MMDSFRPPDFIVVGGQYDDQVYLLASKTLTEAELKKDIRYPDVFDRRSARLTHDVDIKIIAGIKDYVWVRADTYAEAWQTLFAQWSPRQEDRDYVTLDEFKQWELES